DAGAEYVIGCRKNIENDIPIIGHYNVNNEGSGDMYPKGANMLHMIRQVINDDVKWKSILRVLNSTFYHQTVTYEQLEDYINKQSGINFISVFEQYLTTTKIPVLEYMFKDESFGYHWSNCVAEFDMPVKVKLNGIETWLKPTTE